MSSFAQNIDQETVYFKTLHLKNVRCFKGEHTIDFSDGKDNPAQWTVILGNNNTGKMKKNIVAFGEYIELMSIISTHFLIQKSPNFI